MIVDCSNVYINRSTLCKDIIFDGAFAKNKINKGEIVEKGIVRLLSDNFDGNSCPYVFTWSDDIPNKKWAITSGMAMFYNTSKDNPNVKMERNFKNNTFKIIALKNINKDDELFHTYKSLNWRKCFSDLR